MLGALSLKWKWRERREAAGKDTTRPNLVFGGDVHVVWEKFCRYFDVEPRIIPLQPDKYTIGPEDVEPHVDENTIGVAAVLGTTFTGHADDIVGHQRPARAPRATSRGSTSRCTSTAPAAASCGRSCTPTRSGTSGSSRSARSTSPATSSGSSTRASAGSIFRETQRPRRGPRLLRELPRQDRRDVHAELLDRLGDGARAVLQLRPLRPRRLPLHHGDDAGQRPRARRADRARSASSELIGDAGAEQLPLVAFQLAGRARLRRVRRRLAARRRARLDGARPTRCRRTREHVTIMRALVKLTLGHSLASTLADDIAAGVRDARRRRAACTSSTASASRPAPATEHRIVGPDGPPGLAARDPGWTGGPTTPAEQNRESSRRTRSPAAGGRGIAGALRGPGAALGERHAMRCSRPAGDGRRRQGRRRSST